MHLPYTYVLCKLPQVDVQAHGRMSVLQVSAGQYECIYSNMPPFGLGGAMGHVQIEGRHHTAKGRIGLTKGDDHPASIQEQSY